MKQILIAIVVLYSTICFSQNIIIINTNIDTETMLHQVIGKKVQLVDVRSMKEYTTGHIDDAIHIAIADKNNFKKEINKLDKNKPIYIYCYSGVRSNRASKILKTAGFNQIYDYEGGWKAWSTQKINQQ